jgi:hypothetical protein
LPQRPHRLGVECGLRPQRDETGLRRPVVAPGREPGEQDRTIKIWDAAPLTPESAAEREAIGLLAGLFGKPLCSDDVIDFLKTTPTIRPQVLHRALALVTSYRQKENADRCHQAAWDIVRRPYLTAPPCGVALYRVYREALATLTQTPKAREAVPAALAFLAMTQHQLGEPQQAQATLARLREGMKQPDRANDVEARAFLREAEALLRGPAAERRE